MAALDAKRYKLIVEALEYKVRNKTNRLITKFKGWAYEGRNGIFWTARRNFPQVYNREHPQQTAEGNLEFAEAVTKAHNLKQDAVLEKFFDDFEAPTLDKQTADIIDQTEKQEAPAPVSTGVAVAERPPTVRHISSEKEEIITPEESELTPVEKQAEAVASEKWEETKPVNPDTQPGQAPLPNYFKSFTENPNIRAAGGRIAGAAESTQPTIKRFSTNIGQNLMGMLGNGARSAGGFLTGSSGTPGIGGVLNTVPNRISRLDARAKNARNKLAARKRLLWPLVGIFIFMMLIFSTGFSAGGPTSPGGNVGVGLPTTGGSCPEQSAINTNKQSPNTCRYFGLGVNLFNTTIPQAEIDKYINHYGNIFVSAGKGTLEEFKNRVNYIITSAGAAGLNPVLFLGYWKTESRFSTVGNRDLGCSAAAVNFYEQVDCALGVKAFSDPSKNPIANCARSKDANSVACQALKSIRKSLDQTNPISYPINTVDDFAEAHGSRFPDLDGVGKTNNNCTSTYNQLVEVAEELDSCHVTSPPSTPGPTACNLPSTSGGTTGGMCKFTYYCQGNTQWRNKSYAGQTIGNAACGPTALAMIVNYFGTPTDPDSMASAFTANGFAINGGGSNLQGAIGATGSGTWFHSLGFEIGKGLLTSSGGKNILDLRQAIEELNKGYLIIGSSREFPCASCTPASGGAGAPIDHIFVVDNVNALNNTVSIRDPNNCSYSDGNDEISTNIVHAVNQFNWAYAYSIKTIK